MTAKEGEGRGAFRQKETIRKREREKCFWSILGHAHNASASSCFNSLLITYRNLKELVFMYFYFGLFLLRSCPDRQWLDLSLHRQTKISVQLYPVFNEMQRPMKRLGILNLLARDFKSGANSLMEFMMMCYIFSYL